ncbi:protein arginine methyltransferase-like, partial [Scleropages formosus]
DGVCVFKFSIGPETECCRVGTQSFLITLGCVSVLLCFRTRTVWVGFELSSVARVRSVPSDGTAVRVARLRWNARRDAERSPACSDVPNAEPRASRLQFNAFHTMLSTQSSLDKEQSAFDQRTDVSSARQYFQFYGCLSQQQNMLQDYLRTATYQKAILLNEVDFRDKVVLDVGCGSGILSFFAIQAGARKVYAVEASSVAKYTQMLVKSNHLSDRITVLAGKIEEVSFPERVDIIVSEPIGYMLLNERMLESYLHSKKWLKPRGMMFPTFSDLHLAPFTDEQLYMEHYARSSFWHQTSFFGIDLSSLHSAAVDEFFKQPIVDTFDKQILMAKSIKFSINFLEAKEEDLHRMEIPFVFQLLQSGLIHGLAVWFDVAFVGSRTTVWLSTSPSEPLTHWYQVRCLLQTPLFAKAGQTLSGTVLLVANKRQGIVDQSGFKSGNTLDLKNPFF